MKNYEKMIEGTQTLKVKPVEKRIIASPKMISKLSPTLKAVGVNSPSGLFKIDTSKFAS